MEFILFKFILLLVFCHVASPELHSLKYFYTASSEVPNLPEFVSVGLVDGVEIFHCDSNTQRAEPRQDWMNTVTADDPQYWASESALCVKYQKIFRQNIDILKNRFNQTGGVHTLQWMYGCEWEVKTGNRKGYDQYGYDGEDFISFDLNTQTWIAPRPEGFLTRTKFDLDRDQSAYLKKYLTKQCISWLNKYLDYGTRTLESAALPSVSLLQKSPSSPVTCHATGFYPRTASVFWRRDGEELQEVKQEEILPNPDGTFQRSVDLHVSSVRPEDWRRYECVFQLSGVRDIVTTLDPEKIHSNFEKPSDETIPIIAAVVVVVVVVLIIIIAVLGFRFYKQKRDRYHRNILRTLDRALFKKGRMMERRKEKLLRVLEDLGDEELQKFKRSLQQDDILKDYPTIPKRRLEEAGRLDTVDLMIQTYGEETVDVTMMVLSEMDRNDLVQCLSLTNSEPEDEELVEFITAGPDNTITLDRSLFKKDACELTLDTNTTNKNLILSEDNRKVTAVTEKQPYPDHPERFDHWKQILCENGLTGRCYWEVKRKGVVVIGVTYRGIRRRGDRVDCVLGWNNKSWSLICSDKSFSVWHKSRGTPLPVSSSSNRVAVYLDWPAGSLSFYSVSSDTLIHLHTFSCRFTKPLYPGFGFLSRDSSVSLC